MARLVAASMAARERHLLLEVEARARDEQIRLREEQSRLKEQTLKSELAIAVEKSERAKTLRRALVLSLILLAVAAAAAIAAFAARAQARREKTAAVAAAQEALAANQALKTAREQETAQNQRLVQTLGVQLDELKKAVAASSSNPTLQQRIDQAGYSIAKATVAPRVYIHIADETQRAAARELELRLEATRIGDRGLVVPGIERVTSVPPRSLLRCFVADECKEYGPQILAAINRQLAEPRLGLQDFSGTYTPDGSIRALHFEIYFAAGPIVLRPDGTKQSAY